MALLTLVSSQVISQGRVQLVTSIAPENLKIGHPKKNLIFPLIDVSGAMVFLGRVLFLGCFREGLFLLQFQDLLWLMSIGQKRKESAHSAFRQQIVPTMPTIRRIMLLG